MNECKVCSKLGEPTIEPQFIISPHDVVGGIVKPLDYVCYLHLTSATECLIVKIKYCPFCGRELEVEDE